MVKVCQSCAGFAPLDVSGGGGGGDVPCDSRDCPVFYTRVKQRARVGVEGALLEPLLGRLGGRRGGGMEGAAEGLDW